jgi:hypothetical protein
MNRLIKFNDGYIFRDVTDIAEKMYGVDDLYAVDVEEQTESLRRICTEVGHLE